MQNIFLNNPNFPQVSSIFEKVVGGTYLTKTISEGLKTGHHPFTAGAPTIMVRPEPPALPLATPLRRTSVTLLKGVLRDVISVRATNTTTCCNSALI